MHRRVPGKAEAFGTMTRITILSLTVLTTICLIASCSTAQQLPANGKPLSAEKKILIVYLPGPTTPRRSQKSSTRRLAAEWSRCNWRRPIPLTIT
jgi:hypothetical protein